MTNSKTKDGRNSKSPLCDPGSCKVEALVAMDARGQVVLPKNVREKAGFNGGDKLAVVSWERNGKVCCITLQKADDLETMVKNSLGPILKQILS